MSNIRIRRKRLELTQLEVSVRAGPHMSQSKYSAIERGNLKANRLDRERIAGALNVEESALWQENPNNLHQISNDEWFTPRFILEKLGKFNLDPCTVENRPWPTAVDHLTKEEDGLAVDWRGRVWCNPPFTGMDPWMARMADHGNGILLAPAKKMETLSFFKYVWDRADAILIMRGRLRFHTADGKLAGGHPTFSTVFVAYGGHNAHVLRLSEIEGVFIPLRGHAEIINTGMFRSKEERPPQFHPASFSKPHR